MFCTSSPRPARQKRLGTPQAIEAEVRERIELEDCVTERDLELAGFTRADIAAHAPAAIARVRRARDERAAASVRLDA